MSNSVASTLLVVTTLISVIAIILFWRTRKLLREAKNYERGLKMIPLLIHLPPPSDDIEAKGRDYRDIADENISKAQVLYNIIASTAVKGFKSKFYGQRHISLEIVATKGSIYYYASVPIALVSVVKQAILSAYPNSVVEEVAEHNIFSPVGKISGTVGGELVLKESYVYPIATFQDLKRDSMQTILNALSGIDKQDGVGIQILLRPAHSGWYKTSASEASKRREGKKSKGGAETAFWWLKQIFIAPVKPPEALSTDQESKPEKPGSQLDQTIADAIEEKTRHAGYEVMIRVIVSSNVLHKAQVILGNVVASFALFDAPGKNGFKFVPTKDVESFATAYILRFFPPESNRLILNSVELATLFHFPDSSSIPTSNVERQASKQVDGPQNIMEGGLLLGYNVFRGVKKPIRLSENDRRRHIYVVGQTGTGKSKFLENLAVQDMLEGRGFAFVDPHGDSAEVLLGMVPKERTEDIIYFCPADMDYPMGLNIFEYQTEDQKDFLIQEAIAMLYKLYDPMHQGIMGPRYEHLFRNAALAVMADPAGGTFIDIPKLFRDPQYVNQKLKYVKDNTVREFWLKEIPQSQRSSEFGDMTNWFNSKFGAFLSNQMMRNIIGQTKSAFDIREIMDSGKILLVNLSKGRTGELNSQLLGMIFVMKFQAAAMSRANVPEDQRRDFCLYVDEFQNFSTESFATILSEARKYRLSLTVANQFVSQLSDEIRDAVFGNIGTIVAHRVGISDAELLAKYFDPVFDVDDLERLPTANTIVHMLIGGVPAQPFSMVNLPMLAHGNKQLADALKQLSAAKYGKPKSIVEAEIFKRLETVKPVSNPPGIDHGSPFGTNRTSGFPNTSPAPSTAKSSFLDEWLAKRKKMSHSKPLDSADVEKPKKTADNHKIGDGTSVEYNQQAKHVKRVEPAEAEKISQMADNLKRRIKKDNTVKNDRLVSGSGVFKHNDTIFIDKEGNLTQKEKD
ncbi:MAG TPA: ATP-binding protein [Candidatus Saccharibacteria bacterium]|nr:ATP-binding protein [Candidatus Saccharibacteria bacterium]